MQGAADASSALSWYTAVDALPRCRAALRLLRQRKMPLYRCTAGGAAGAARFHSVLP